LFFFHVENREATSLVGGIQRDRKRQRDRTGRILEVRHSAVRKVDLVSGEMDPLASKVHNWSSLMLFFPLVASVLGALNRSVYK